MKAESTLYYFLRGLQSNAFYYRRALENIRRSLFHSSDVNTSRRQCSPVTMNSSMTFVESWFIPINILMSICTIAAIVLCTLFLCITIFDKTCHAVPMMLLANTCLAMLGFASTLRSMSIAAIQNDLRRIYFQDSFCIIRFYASAVAACWVTYSFLIESIYRYVTVIHPTRLFWQSVRCQVTMICISWVFGFTYPFAFLFTGEIVYDSDNQVCQLPLRLSFPMIYATLCVYLVPLSLIMFIYVKLVRYVKQINRRVIAVNLLARAQRELKMVRRIIILIAILMILGIPYTVFIIMSFFHPAPQYHFRIAYIFTDVSLPLMMVVLFQFNEPLKASLIRRFNPRVHVVTAVTA